MFRRRRKFVACALLHAAQLGVGDGLAQFGKEGLEVGGVPGVQGAGAGKYGVGVDEALQVPGMGAGDPAGERHKVGRPVQLARDGGAELVVNQLDAAPFMVDVDVKLTHYDKIPYDAWKLIEEDFYIFANISYDDFVTRIPEKFRMNMNFYSLATKGYKDSGQDDEYRLHDYVFDCQSDEGVKVTIALCNFEAPIRDSFIHDENPEVSSVNGTPVTIYGYDNMYMVNFSYEGVNYDIETRDIELNQLQELLTNIMC